ncbi:AbiTii domain-containing protein [Phascolarctobacterium succinatutens]|uniref:AbiTii domain-containing protein n=1 Tax=Phascolarctobacterium succinatutens TaxID=626940 RepID=UPI003F7E0EEE
MGIIQELQAEIINPDADINNVLRKALLVSHKLQLKEFEKWIKNELNGYADTDDLPIFRKNIKGKLKFFNPFRGWCPIQFETRKEEDSFTTIDIMQSVPQLLALIKDSKGTLSMKLPPEIVRCLWKDSFIPEMETSLIFDKSVFVNIIEQVKTNLLDWVLLLEDQGISGDSVNFSISEKEKVKNSKIINNYQTNIYGNLDRSQLQQGTSESQQTSN